MRAVVIVLALTGLAMPAVLADPAPTQTPAQLQQSAPAAPAPGLTSQQDKAAADEADKSKQRSQLAAKTPAPESSGDKKPAQSSQPE